jgi:hypothetical protein
MTLFKEWVDFIIWPEQPDGINSLAERTDIATAERPQSCSYTPDSKAIIQQSMIDREDDPFEAIEINSSGAVMIWTKNKIWQVVKNTDGTVEKLSCVPRNPPED